MLGSLVRGFFQYRFECGDIVRTLINKFYGKFKALRLGRKFERSWNYLQIGRCVQTEVAFFKNQTVTRLFKK